MEMPTGIIKRKCDVTQNLKFSLFTIIIFDLTSYSIYSTILVTKEKNTTSVWVYRTPVYSVIFFFNIALHSMYLLHKDKVWPKKSSIASLSINIDEKDQSS